MEGIKNHQIKYQKLEVDYKCEFPIQVAGGLGNIQNEMFRSKSMLDEVFFLKNEKKTLLRKEKCS